MALSAGTYLGRYEILTPLGAGGMGEVYKARDARLERIVAIKVLASHLSENPGRRARFDREARAISRLTHSHICTLYDVGHAGGIDYLVLEYLEGQTLAGRLQQGPLPTDQLLKAGIEIGEGLQRAHHEGIIHRDLKPANVMLTKTGAKLLDFGLAKACGESDSDRLEVPTKEVDPTLTDPGTVMGTLPYMAPEQLEGRKADPRTDIFALGVMLYEMTTGKKPFAGTSKASLIGSILKEEPAPITELTPMAPPALDRLIRQCLEKDPEERWHSVHDIVKELKWIRDGSKAAMTPVSGATLAVRPKRKAWLLSGIVVATLLATVVALHPWRKAAGRVSGPTVPRRIAVLPFENQGTLETDYFAEGMSDQVRGKLASLPGFEVVASTTSSQYKKTTKVIEQVARELEVRYLVVGKVRWDVGRGRVQVIPELVEVAQTGAALEKWGQPFDAALTDVFQVQTEIAGRVAQSLGVALSAGQQGVLAEKPTQNLAAYDAFLRGDMAYRRESWREAAKAYEQAVKLDPNFALAWAHLSRAHSAWYEFSTAADAKMAQEAAERAIALAPERPDGYLARAQHYAFIENDSAQGLIEIEHAERLGPRDVDVLNRKARLERNLGRFEESVRVSEEAKQLDPRSIATARDLADTLSYLRRQTEAQAESDRARALDPTDLSALAKRVDVSLDQGDLAGARAVLRAASKDIEAVDLVMAAAAAVWVLDDAQQQLLLTVGFDRFDNGRADWALTRASVYALRRDAAKTRESAELARAELETQLRAAPQRWWLHMSHALALAYLGRKVEAIAEGEQAAELVPVTQNAIVWPENQQALAAIYLRLGEHEKALDRLEPLLTIPDGPSPGRLRIDPAFAPLRGNPRFEKLARGQQ
jgi:TolB-like protein/tRNA A-37 threonylcarbamoyl transferase component Bud32/Tfp pilus assembly protein PilF